MNSFCISRAAQRSLNESNVNDFKQMILTTRAMPKMVIGDDQVLHGVPRSKEVLLQTLGQHYKLN